MARIRRACSRAFSRALTAATSAASVLVLKASMPAPHASIQGHDPKTTTRDEKLRLVLTADQPNLCDGLSLAERRMVIEWRENTGQFAADGPACLPPTESCTAMREVWEVEVDCADNAYGSGQAYAGETGESVHTAAALRNTPDDHSFRGFNDTTLIGDAELSSLKSPNTVGEVSFCPNVKAEEEKPGSTPPNGLALSSSFLFPPPGFEGVGLTECLVLLYDDLTLPSAAKPPPVFFSPDEVVLVVLIHGLGRRLLALLGGGLSLIHI